VAITRAKKALYVIGHLRTFKGNKDWKMFINHAEKQSVVVSVDRDMRCAQECLNRKATVSKSAESVSTEKSIEVPQVPLHRDNLNLTIPAGAVSLKEKHPAVDRSAFPSPRKGTKFVDPLPLSTKPAKKSIPINSPTKRFPSSSTEQSVAAALLDSPVTPSKTKAIVPAADKSFTDHSSTTGTVKTVAHYAKNLSGNIMQGLHSDYHDVPIQDSTVVDNVASGISSHNSTSVKSTLGKSRLAGVAVANVTKHLDTVHSNVISSTWGGQRKRISHYTKRSHSDNVTSNDSKRVKHNSFS